MTPALETPRLLLRPLEFADAEQARRLFGQWEIVRHLAARVPWPYPPDAGTRLPPYVSAFLIRATSDFA